MSDQELPKHLPFIKSDQELQIKYENVKQKIEELLKVDNELALYVITVCGKAEESTCVSHAISIYLYANKIANNPDVDMKIRTEAVKIWVNAARLFLTINNEQVACWYKKNLHYYVDAARLSLNVGNDSSAAFIYEQVACWYENLHHYADAIKFLDQAIKYWTFDGNRICCLTKKATIMADKLSEYESAFHDFKEADRLSGSIAIKLDMFICALQCGDKNYMLDETQRYRNVASNFDSNKYVNLICDIYNLFTFVFKQANEARSTTFEWFVEKRLQQIIDASNLLKSWHIKVLREKAKDYIKQQNQDDDCPDLVPVSSHRASTCMPASEENCCAKKSVDSCLQCDCMLAQHVTPIDVAAIPEKLSLFTLNGEPKSEKERHEIQVRGQWQYFVDTLNENIGKTDSIVLCGIDYVFPECETKLQKMGYIVSRGFDNRVRLIYDHK